MDLPPTLLNGKPKFINYDQCQVIETIHEPADPLGDLGPANECGLLFYCDPSAAGILTPWPRIRSRCTWFPDVVQVHSLISIFDPNTGGFLRACGPRSSATQA